MTEFDTENTTDNFLVKKGSDRLTIAFAGLANGCPPALYGHIKFFLIC
jgi:hypothetical protein